MHETTDISKYTLEADRLILRPFKEEDINDFFEYASVEGVGEMAGWVHHQSIEVTKRILNNFINEKNVFAVVFKENEKVIGSLGLHNSWAKQTEQYECLNAAEIGYVLSKDYWGKGLMPEAVNLMIPFCFNILGMDLLTVAHYSENVQSKRVIEKCGFKHVKQAAYYSEQLDKTRISEEYILTKENYTGIK